MFIGNLVPHFLGNLREQPHASFVEYTNTTTGTGQTNLDESAYHMMTHVVGRRPLPHLLCNVQENDNSHRSRKCRDIWYSCRSI